MAELDLSILERIKKRIYGEEKDAQDTQVIPNFENSILFGPTQKISEFLLASPENTQIELENTQLEDRNTQDGPENAIRLPQLALDESDFAKPASTQKVMQKSMFAQETEPIPDTPPSREKRIAQLAEKKRQERLLQEQQLEAEISHTTLTDEENDLEADTTRDSSVQKNVTTKKELEQIEKFLSEQKRNRDIQPAFVKKDTDPVKQLLAAFDSDSETEKLTSDLGPKLSPTTSPMKNDAKDVSDHDSDSDFDITNVLDLISHPHPPPKPATKNPIDVYAQRIRKEIMSSPTRPDSNMVNLDDSDDSAEELKQDVPELSKEQRLLIKQKFSKKRFSGTKNAIFSKFHHLHNLRERKTRLFDELRRANAKQLHELKKTDPDAELMEEIEKEDEEMGTLLEREMERARRVRKKEKFIERAKQAQLGEDKDYKEGDLEIDEEVPESDIDSDDVNSDGDDEEEDNDDEESTAIKRPRRVVLSDDDDEVDAPKLKEIELPRNDDSYMFGGSSQPNDAHNKEEEVMQIQSDLIGSASPQLQTLEQVIHTDQDSYRLFQNLAPRSQSQLSRNNSMLNEDSLLATEVPSFQDISSTQVTMDLDNVLPTQADTQPLGDQTQAIQAKSTQTDESAYSDEDEDIPAAINRGRKLIRKNNLAALPEEEEVAEEEDNEQSEEMLKERLAIYEAKIRRKELRARKLRKEMEHKGVKNVVEGEAEESDDEWKGVGGVDGDDSDQANSDDEKMIDNAFNLDLNDEEVRKKFMEQYHIKDRKELEKLMDDIKNHKLTKRARGNGFDIELSDEEDELLMAYRRQKLQEQKQRLMANQKLHKLAKNDRAKAFFESIQDEVVSIVLDEADEASDSEKKEDTPAESQTTEPDVVEEDVPRKRVIRLEEAFVQRQLSFLTKCDEDDYASLQRASRAQHGLDSDEDIEDLSTLKSRSLSNLYAKSSTPELVLDKSTKRSHDVETDDDEDDGLSHVFKKPSVISSFRSFHEKQGVQVSTISFSGVTVNKQYKVASGGKASISYLSRSSRAKQTKSSSSFRSLKVRKIEESVDKAKAENTRRGLFGSGSTFT